MAIPDQEQKLKANAFRAMHFGEHPLVLVNVWDIASARVVEEASFPALATTSAGIAFAKGFPDGQRIHPDLMISAIAQIADAVRVPVTADVEAGYGSTPERAARTTRNILLGGVAGMNFEDATGDADQPLTELPLQVERIRAIRETAEKMDVALVLNARSEVYLLEVGDAAKRYDESVRRLQAYRDAGADCVFLPGLRDAETIRRLVADLKCPVNVLAGPSTPSVAELTAMGVKRISLGSGPMRAAMGHLRRLAREVQSEGTWASMNDAVSYAEMNKLMESVRKPPARLRHVSEK